MNSKKILFESVLSLWPESLDVSHKILTSGGGVTIALLVLTHDLIRDKLLSSTEDDQIIQMDWAIFTVFHKMAKISDWVITAEIDKIEVFSIYDRNTGH